MFWGQDRCKNNSPNPVSSSPDEIFKCLWFLLEVGPFCYNSGTLGLKTQQISVWRVRLLSIQIQADKQATIDYNTVSTGYHLLLAPPPHPATVIRSRGHLLQGQPAVRLPASQYNTLCSQITPHSCVSCSAAQPPAICSTLCCCYTSLLLCLLSDERRIRAGYPRSIDFRPARFLFILLPATYSFLKHCFNVNFSITTSKLILRAHIILCYWEKHLINRTMDGEFSREISVLRPTKQMVCL